MSSNHQSKWRVKRECIYLLLFGSGQREDDWCECLDGPCLALDIVKVEWEHPQSSGGSMFDSENKQILSLTGS